MSEEHRAMALEHNVRVLENALYRIAHNRDCDYVDCPNDKPNPCPCAVCEAKAAIESMIEWRYRGALHYRVVNGFNPRETKIMAAWRNAVDDFSLGKITYEGPWRNGQPADTAPTPSVRDWFVASSVVQWLATNVGMAVLEAAGFKYSGWDEDRESIDQKRQRQEQK